ncbi:capping complex subunit for YIEGIA [Natranaerobius thermophilus]|uniref:Uncharacterized protein n=1 Tax=Natranaerobius thermophilus (strain ATCC BAA-1301 / DSM 18059 / JW/NM-WN-LF) TaxID=457570 RepID=B2A4N2_NATTJ|nr:hypothetical protein [Natranaerobius thermophilus]ACB85207.1 conserved hypothetical protein [Natranaerobius thermophilus JW/NM-WN-LF]
MRENIIVALVTIYPEKVSSGTIPIFYENSKEDAERTARIVARITRGIVHSLDNGVLIISS